MMLSDTLAQSSVTFIHTLYGDRLISQYESLQSSCAATLSHAAMLYTAYYHILYMHSLSASGNEHTGKC